jgi:predicted nucleic acid-binding protein
MSAEQEHADAAQRAFFDTNVLVYAHDASEPRKRDLARALLLEHLGAGTLCTSAQVLSEYFSVVTTKGETRMTPAAASWLVEQVPPEAVVTLGLDGLRAAVARCARGGLSIWDAMVVEAAVAAGAKVLLTEDASLLRAVDASSDGLCAVDPFAPADRTGPAGLRRRRS